MTVGIVGLGLIGGSFAKAYNKAGHRVLAFDINREILNFSMLSGVVNGELTDDRIPGCNLILICTYPLAAVAYMEEKAGIFGKKPVVMDCCGTKRNVVDAGRALGEKYGFTYVGGHPMAGTQYSGFKYSRADLYVGAPMVLVPPVYDDVNFLERIKELLAPAGFGSLSVTDADNHDEVIAFSSQLAHVVSGAYVKSPTSRKHTGFSAGSYRDMTRVAWLNPEMWTQLFLDNRDNLIREIDTLIDNLTEYRDALSDGDRERLIRILDEGRRIKEEVDGK